MGRRGDPAVVRAHWSRFRHRRPRRAERGAGPRHPALSRDRVPESWRAALPVRGMTGLYAANHPARFWRLVTPEAGPAEWDAAIGSAAAALPYLARAAGDDVERLLEATLGEGQFGRRRFRLSRARRAYYLLKPLLPRSLVLRGRRRARALAQRTFPLGWPIEDRYRRFLWDAAAGVLALHGLNEAPFIWFWPDGAAYALVLTHDVETGEGQRFVSQVADLEQRLGLRSSFNFVAERYPLDHGLIEDLMVR